MGPNADNSPGGNRPPEDPAWRDQFRRPPRTPTGRAEVPHVTPGSRPPRGPRNDDDGPWEDGGPGNGPSPWADSLRRRTGRARQRATENAFTDRLRSWAQSLPLPAALRPSDRPAGRHAPGNRPLPNKLAVNPKERRRRRLMAAFAVCIMLIGLGVVGGTYFVDGVKTADQLTFPNTTTVYYSDGTPLSKLGEVTRYELSYDQMNDAVLKTIVASEDQTFWTNDGVDFGSVLRAAWNNFTGGDVQGGSTITQQYARLAFDLQGVTYQRKAREAVLAWKISDKLDKKTILASYLNAVPFGRQTYGIEAAAQAYFGKTAKRTAPPEQQITWAEAMVLVSMVKQPNPDPEDPVGHPGYDPSFSPEAKANSQNRWNYVKDQLVATNVMSKADADKLVYPGDKVKPYDPNAGNGLETPAGMVVNHVLSELTHTPGSPFYGAKDWRYIRDGGFQIYTTLNHGVQQAAEGAADGFNGSSPMNGQPANLQDALVAVQPGTGRVLAYYGGHDGKGADYAGFYYDEKGVATGVGRFPAGSSFKIYTLAAALKAGISLKSYWDWNPHDMLGRTGKNQIRNASTCGDLKAGDPTPCSLLQSTISSLNVPFYAVTLSTGPAKVLQMARDAGVDYMWTDARDRVDLRPLPNMSSVVPSKFDTILGIGQYPITVMDHANGLATFAAEGLRAQAHFVQKVMKGNDLIYSEKLPAPNQPRVFSQQNSNDLTYALSQVVASKTNIGWDTAGKTGTWEYAQNSNENADAWMIGFDKKIAAAVWLGNKAEEHPLRDKNNAIIYGAGVPASIWKKFMTDATTAMNEKKVNTKFNPPAYAGDTNPPGSVPGPDDNKFKFPFPFGTPPERSRGPRG
jgi:membrane peptidoglycan carboxypeptidase